MDNLMTKRYHLSNIRTLLTEGFTDDELRRLCYDIPEFRPIYDELSQETGKSKIIDRLIEYANRKLKLEELLAWANQHNPARYEAHQPYHISTINPFTSADSYEKSSKIETTRRVVKREEVYLALGLAVAIFSCMAGWLALPQIQRLWREFTPTSITPSSLTTNPNTPQPPTLTPASASPNTSNPIVTPIPTLTEEKPVLSKVTSQQGVQIQDRGTILIGVNQTGFPPFSLRNGNDYSGFEIELAQEIVQRLFGKSIVIEWVPLSRSEHMEAVQSGRADFVIRNTSHTVEREAEVAFTSNYFNAGTRLMVRRNEGYKGIGL
jgi:hypothetical protein